MPLRFTMEGLSMLGLQRGTIRIVPADPAWATAFVAEHVRLNAAIGHLVVDIQHVGSTSVPGLDAKPVIDIALAVASPDDIARCRPLVLALGYLDLGDGGSDGGYLFVRERQPELRTHHLHIVTRDDPQWANYLRFRDRLRADDALRDEYGALKRTLQETFAHNRRGYTEAKGPFICSVLEQVPLSR
jgi:GrpB-like predicted nucleotidyltransferase (UPF0157 family)